MTIYDTDTFNLPAPSDIELAALDRRINWPGFDVQPTTRCGYAFWCQLRNVNGARPYLWTWIEDNCEHPPQGEKRIYTVARWDSLLACYEHECQEQDARDERETVADARAAAHW